MLENIWEFAKAAGSLAGLATGLFVVWDRIFRHRPACYFVVRTLGARLIHLRVENASPRTILLSLPTKGRSSSFALAPEAGIEAIVSAVQRGTTEIALEGKSSIDLFVIKPHTFVSAPGSEIHTAELHWREAQRRRFDWQHTLRASISKEDFETMEQGKKQTFDQPDGQRPGNP